MHQRLHRVVCDDRLDPFRTKPVGQKVGEHAVIVRDQEFHCERDPHSPASSPVS